MSDDFRVWTHSGEGQFRRDPAPARGPAFPHSSQDPKLVELPGGSMLMFDLSRLTLADYRVMRHHPQVNASLSLMTFMLHQVDWRIECEDARIASVVEDNLRILWSRLVRSMSTALWAGYSPCALEWENAENGRWVYVSKVKDMVPEDCSVYWKEVESSYIPPAEYQTSIRPKVKVFDGIDVRGLSYPIPPEHSFWYPILMENGNYYGRNLLKAAFMPWYFSLMIHLFSNRYFERFGEPVPIGRAPFEEEFRIKRPDGTFEIMTAKQAMEQMLLGLRNRGTVVIPSERDPTASGAGGRSEYLYDIEYLESQLRGADFERYMARLDEEISLAMFTPTLLMRAGDTGSHNLGVQHTSTWLWALNAIAADMKEYIDRYIVQRMKAINFSPRAPRCEWVPRRMGRDNPETIRSIITALIRGELATVDYEELGTALGMTVTEVKQVMGGEDGSGDEDSRDRVERIRVESAPRRVGEPLSTGREIMARVEGQVIKAFRDGTFGPGFSPSMGYRRRFTQSLVDSGLCGSATRAESVAVNLYETMDRFTKTAVEYGDIKSAEQFMELFTAKMQREFDSLGLS
jgi:hypothetical protein